MSSTPLLLDEVKQMSFHALAFEGDANTHLYKSGSSYTLSRVVGGPKNQFSLTGATHNRSAKGLHRSLVAHSPVFGLLGDISTNNN